MSFKCDKCLYETNRRFNFDRHVAKSHNVENGSFACLLCETRETSRRHLIKHFQEAHHVELMTSVLLFENFDQFLLWKTQFEKDSLSRFVKLKGDHTKVIYRCHREGIFKTRGVGKRRMRLLGSNKINSCCPAEIKAVVEDNGLVTVTVIDTHVGHSKELCRVKLPLKSTRDVSALPIASDASNIQDVNERENILNEKLKRFHLLTRKDLMNISLAYRLGNTGPKGGRDYTSVDSWKEKETEVIRFYKREGTFLSSHPELEVDDFLLVVANDPQIHLLKTHGSSFICADSVYGRGKSDFRLSSLMVLDNLGQCFPCAFMLSNKIDKVSTTVFLSVIRNALGGDLIPSVLMSDMSLVFRAAWASEMPEPSHELFSAWHIEKLWKVNLRKVVDNLKQKETFKVLRDLLREKDETTFSQSLHSTLVRLENDPSTADFARHFRAEYLDNVQCWAHCHRNYCGINPMFLEAMHKTINHIYFVGRKAQKQQRCIYVLMRFIRDKLYDRLTMNHADNLNKMISDIRQQHTKALLMPDIEVQEAKGRWIVSNTNSVPVEIVTNNLNCNCCIKCEDCDVCIHAFHCSCLEAVLKWTMCCHVHFLVTKGVSVASAAFRSATNEDAVLEEIQIVIPDEKVGEQYEGCVIESVIHEADENNVASDDESEKVECISSCVESHREFEEAKQQTADIFQSVMNGARTVDDLQIIQAALLSVDPTVETNWSHGITLVPKCDSPLQERFSQSKTNIEDISWIQSSH